MPITYRPILKPGSKHLAQRVFRRSELSAFRSSQNNYDARSYNGYRNSTYILKKIVTDTTLNDID